MSNSIHIGDKLHCNKCGHARLITENWLNDVCQRFSLGDLESALEYFSDCLPFRCSKCNEKNVAVTRSENTGTPSSLDAVKATLRPTANVFSTAKNDEATKAKWSKLTCPFCAGSGLDGRCFSCYGTGWVDASF